MADKYDQYSKDDLVRLLRERDRKPRFGLVWERDEIDHDKSVNGDFVALDLDETLSCGAAPYRNLLIEGDNFDALRYLRMTHTGKVKCIYIDPPYNTGNKDFIYNDRFVDKDDLYKHSKWLEYMYRRLTLARDLLRKDGVIFVSIGEDEFANLSLLMDDVFAGMKIGTFVWRRRSGSNDAKGAFLSADHEYVICYANKGFSFGGIAKDVQYSNPDNDPRGDWVDGPLNQGKDFKQRTDAYYPIHNPRTDIWYACDPDSVWRFASKDRLKPGQKIRSMTMEDLVADNRIKWPANENVVCYQSIAELKAAISNGAIPRNLRLYEDLDAIYDAIEKGSAPERLREYIKPLDFWVGKKIGFGKPRLKRLVSEIKRSEKPLSTWVLPSSIKKEDIQSLDLSEVETFQVGFTSEGTTLLAQMIGNKDFSYPKPISLISNLIKQSCGTDDLIVDFFAGSGTTGQAVMEANSEDEGNRRFILVSSTEASSSEPDKNVCRDVARQRLLSTINGYSYKTKDGKKEVDGLGGDFAYLRTRRISTENIFNKIQHNQIWTALQLVHDVGVATYQEKVCIQVAEIEGDEEILLLYVPKISDTAINGIREAVKKKEAIIYSWQPALLRERMTSKRLTFQQIPQYLVDRFGAGTKK